jgi:uncharacterized protein YegL
MQLSFFSCADCKLDIALLVDCSGSIRDNNVNGVDNWGLIVSFLQQLVNGLSITPNGTHVGAVTFGRILFRQTLSIPVCLL